MINKPVAIQVINPYLFHTGPWIYSQLVGVQNVKNIVFSYKKENLNQFPYPYLYCYQDFNIFKKAITKIYKRFWGDNSGLFFAPLIRQNVPVFLHAHMGYEAVRWLKFAQRFKLPLIVTFYGQDASKLGKIPYWLDRYKQLFKYGKLFLAEGSFLKKQLVELGCDENKVIIQHLGVDINKYKAKSYSEHIHGNKIIILQVSTFREKKGIEYSLKAIQILKKNKINFEFRLIGGGDNIESENNIHSLIKELDISDVVKVLGIRTHQSTLEEMDKADIFLHPSVTAKDGDNEGGAPVGIIEASAIGLPVVSTLHADIPEVVINNKTGFLVTEKNSIELTEKISTLVDDFNLRRSFGEHGRKHIWENYNLDIQIKKLEKIYEPFLK